MICGHIHAVSLREVQGLTYMNCGDWVDSFTAVVETQDGRLRLLTHTGEVLAEVLPPAPGAPRPTEGTAAQRRGVALDEARERRGADGGHRHDRENLREVDPPRVGGIPQERDSWDAQEEDPQGAPHEDGPTADAITQGTEGDDGEAFP